MIYNLEFLPSARKEWGKLNSTIQQQFKKKLHERLRMPKVPSAALSGMSNCYKIKLHHLGYRLVYRVEDEVITVIVISIGKRDRGEVYENAKARLQEVYVPVLGKS